MAEEVLGEEAMIVDIADDTEEDGDVVAIEEGALVLLLITACELGVDKTVLLLTEATELVDRELASLLVDVFAVDAIDVFVVDVRGLELEGLIEEETALQLPEIPLVRGFVCNRIAHRKQIDILCHNKRQCFHTTMISEHFREPHGALT